MKQLIKYPHLLRKQYLGRSPLWASFINSHQLPLQVFKINMKLYAGSLLFASIHNRVQNKLLLQQSKQYYQELQDQVKMTILHNSKADKCLEKVISFLQLRESRHKNMENYISELYQMYKRLFPQLFPSQVKNPTLTNLLISLYSLSQVPPTDQIDALIFSTVVNDCQQFDKFIHSICQSNIESNVILTLIKQVMLKLMSDGKFYHTALFRKIFYRLKNYQSKDCGNQSTSFLFSILDNLVSIGSKANDIDISTIRRLMDGHEQKTYIYLLHNIKEQGSMSFYVRILFYQYLVYLDWLSVKCLYRQKSQPFIDLLSQFTRKINFFSINQLLKNRRGKSSKKGEVFDLLKEFWIEEELCKLEILTYLYNQIIQATTVTSQNKDKVSVNWAKFKEFSNEEVGIDKIIQLRKIKMKREKSLSNALLSISHAITKQDEIRQAIRVIRAIDLAIGVINSCRQDDGKDKKLRVRIENQLILKIAVKSLNSLDGVNPIIFGEPETRSILRVMREVKQNKKTVGGLQKSIQDWSRKMQKNVGVIEGGKIDFEQMVKKQKIYQPVEGKMIWLLVKNPKLVQKQDLKKEIEQLRQQLFLISSSVKDKMSKKDSEEEEKSYGNQNSEKDGKSMFMLSVYDFFQ